jgi:hypothetical protein
MKYLIREVVDGQLTALEVEADTKDEALAKFKNRPKPVTTVAPVLGAAFICPACGAKLEVHHA